MTEHVVTSVGVEDIDAAKAFYVDVLGLRIERDHNVFVQFAPVDNTFSLALYTGDPLAYDASRLSPGEHRGITMSHLVDTNEQVDTVVAQAEQAGAKVLEAPHTAAWGGYIAYLVAPDGNLWKIAVRQQG